MNKYYKHSTPLGEQAVKDWPDDTPIQEFRDWVGNGKVKNVIDIVSYEYNVKTIKDLKKITVIQIRQCMQCGVKSSTELRRLLGYTEEEQLKPPEKGK